jgi:hypothetical protein
MHKNGVIRVKLSHIKERSLEKTQHNKRVDVGREG